MYACVRMCIHVCVCKGVFVYICMCVSERERDKSVCVYVFCMSQCLVGVASDDVCVSVRWSVVGNWYD